MKKPAIPRLELETFTKANFGVPLLNVQHYSINGKYFIIENRDSHPVADYISPNRRQFYKIFHITSGTGILTVGLHQYIMGAGDIAFLHPDEIMSWQTTSKATGGHFCLIHPKYFENDADHLLHLFKNYPYFKPLKAVVQLSPAQSETVNNYFECILKEERANNDYKKQALLLHLQMILIEAQRAGKNLADVEVKESYRYIHSFLSLLESSFQVDGPQYEVKLKTAAEFAGHLHVHPNYLNALVKEQTGKTIREHIQERLLYEAKSLLVQTNWDINNISDGLGFSGQAAFTSFFKKKEHVSPSLFRKEALSQVHS